MEAANKNLTRKIINIEHEVKQNGEKLDEIMNHMGMPAPTAESGKYIMNSKTFIAFIIFRQEMHCRRSISYPNCWWI